MAAEEKVEPGLIDGRIVMLKSRQTAAVLRASVSVLVLAFSAFLGAAQPALDDKQATFFMGRVRYSSSEGNDCPGVGQDLMKLVSRASTLKVQEERRIKLTDPELYETPFLFMNGHNDFVLTE